ncbi:MAG TPA: TetR/AcrR family transcriptional regulator [Caulobacteraceae bacterium]|nr:TetR/AcrR family transcriptional regulator [Caulobacteraceae bacterium]
MLSDEAVGEFRERLIDAAERLFAAHGLDAVTMRQLAGELGVSPMTPYRYFADKGAILAAVRARAFRRHAEALEAARAGEGPGGLERSSSVSRAYVRFAVDHPEAYKLMFDVEQPNASDYPELVAASERSRATMTAHLHDLIEAGVLPRDADADLIGHMFWSALHGALQLQFAGMIKAPYDAERLGDALMETIWAGVLAASPG